MFSRLALRAVVAGCALVALAGTTRADMVYIGDKELPGQFTGTVEVFGQTTTSATIRVTLKNVSPQANGGFITGLAFNDPNQSNPGPNISTVTSYSTTYNPSTGQNFTLIGGALNGTTSTDFTNGISTSPYGNFDIGAAVGGNWLGGGMPSDGLAVGQTGTFTFVVSGNRLTGLTAASLLGAMSTNGTAGFAVRFRGFKDGSSDKDLAGVVTPNPVPAPPGAVLACVGIAGLFVGRLRRKAL